MKHIIIEEAVFFFQRNFADKSDIFFISKSH